MDKRYQVFISSTYEDLKDERKEIIENLLNLKYFPAGMEMFSASNEEQFKYLKKIIDNCDYYVLILGARYGSVEKNSGKSFTELEYDYALERGIPILSFVHNDPDNIIANKREKDNVKLFTDFRNKVLGSSRMCKLWTQKSDLISNVIISLVQIVDEFPRVGWIRGDVVQASSEVLMQNNQLRNEIDRLKKENEKLKNNTETERNSYSNSILASGEDTFEVFGVTYDISKTYDSEEGHVEFERAHTKERHKATWNDMFKKVAPDIFSAVEEHVFRDSLNDFFERDSYREKFRLSKESYITIKFQMVALGWIVILESGEQYEDDYICLTEKGKKDFMDMITVKKEIQ